MRTPKFVRTVKAFAVTLTLIFALFGSTAAAQTTADTDGTISTLVDVLKDENARNILITELEGLLATALPEAVEEPVVERISISRRIALFTQSTVESTFERIAQVRETLTSSDNAFSGLGGDEFKVLWAALPSLLMVIALTIGVYLLLRFLAIPFYRRLGRRAVEANALQTAFMFIGSNLFDALIVIVAWGIGYAVTVLAIGEVGTIGIRQTMYLNAFMLVELTKVVIRAMLSPNATGLRVVPLETVAVQKLTKYITVVVSVMGYGQLLVVPILNQNASFAAGDAMTALLAVFVLLYLVYVVIKQRTAVSNWVVSCFDPKTSDAAEAGDLSSDEIATLAENEITEHSGRHGFRAFFIGLAQSWYWFALLYLTAMFVVVMTMSAQSIFGALLGSGKVIAAVVVASLVSGFLGRSISKGVSFPLGISQKLPLLEPRVNGFLSKAFKFFRLLVLIFVSFFVLDVIGLLDMKGWLESQVGLQFTGTLVSLALLLFTSFMIWLALTSWVDFRLNPEYGAVPTARETTLLTLLRNAATIVIVILTLMFSLSEIGLDIGPLLASAGVLGLAIGFGAQKMVQDIITGVFIQFENAINVGDIITVGGTTGTVEKLSVRSVSLRDVHGVFHIIPFSSVDMVSNFSRDFAFFVCDMGVAYRENVDDVKIAMQDSFDELRLDKEIGELILDDLEWFGVNAFGDSAVVVRARIKTVAGKQFGVGRAYNGVLKKIFDARNIEIPFPHQTIFFGEAKDGSRQPIRIQGDEAAATES